MNRRKFLRTLGLGGVGAALAAKFGWGEPEIREAPITLANPPHLARLDHWGIDSKEVRARIEELRRTPVLYMIDSDGDVYTSTNGRGTSWQFSANAVTVVRGRGKAETFVNISGHFIDILSSDEVAICETLSPNPDDWHICEREAML